MKHINICPHQKNYAKCLQRNLIYNAGNVNEWQKCLDVHTCLVALFFVYVVLKHLWWVICSEQFWPLVNYSPLQLLMSFV